MSEELRDDHHSTVIGCGLLFVVEWLFALIDARTIGPLAMWLDVAHALLAGGALVWLFARPNASRLEVSVLFALVALSLIPQTWVTELAAAHRGVVRDPLLAHEFLLLGVAMLVPSARVFGMTLLALVMVSGLGLWWALSPRPASLGGVGEPWMLVVFSLIALVVTHARFERRAAMHALWESRAEAAAFSRVARVFRAFRDRANTPLQTLEIGTTLLTRGEVSTEGVCAMDRAIDQLRSLSAMLEKTDVANGAASLHTESSDLASAIDDAVRAYRSARTGASARGQP